MQAFKLLDVGRLTVARITGSILLDLARFLDTFYMQVPNQNFTFKNKRSACELVMAHLHEEFVNVNCLNTELIHNEPAPNLVLGELH